MQENMTQDKAASLGDLIRQYRLRKLQVNGRPWAQEDLAVAIGNDKAYINRIEKGKHIPTMPTIDKICKALELNWAEQRKLLDAAGYYPLLPVPEESEIQSITEELDSFIMQIPNPCSLLDNEEIIWNINELEAIVYFGYKNREECLEDCRGFRLIELLMAPRLSDWFKNIVENYDEFLARQVARFRQTYYKAPSSDEYEYLLRHIFEDEFMRKIWRREEFRENNPQSKSGNIKPTFTNYQLLKLNHPTLGHLEVRVWHNEIFDERFKLTQLVPNNVETMQAFMKVSAEHALNR